MLNCDSSTSDVVPLNCVFDDLGSQLIFEIECDLEFLTETTLSKLLNLSRGGQLDVLDLVIDDKIREIHVNL